MIKLILKQWKIVAGIVLVLAGAGIWTYRSHLIRALREERDTALIGIQSHEQAIEILQKDSASKISALESEHEREIARVRGLESILGKIEGASDEQDGPVAPVLRDTIDSLYKRPAETSESD